MHHFISETLPLFCFGLAGIVSIIFSKINDLNHKPENDALTFGQTMQKFFRKEWASYMVSITIIAVASCTHDEWLQWFTNGKLATLVEVPLGVKLAMYFFGMSGHYLLYKFWLGKME